MSLFFSFSNAYRSIQLATRPLHNTPFFFLAVDIPRIWQQQQTIVTRGAEIKVSGLSAARCVRRCRRPGRAPRLMLHRRVFSVARAHRGLRGTAPARPKTPRKFETPRVKATPRGRTDTRLSKRTTYTRVSREKQKLTSTAAAAAASDRSSSRCSSLPLPLTMATAYLHQVYYSCSALKHRILESTTPAPSRVEEKRRQRVCLAE